MFTHSCLRFCAFPQVGPPECSFYLYLAKFNSFFKPRSQFPLGTLIRPSGVRWPLLCISRVPCILFCFSLGRVLLTRSVYVLGSLVTLHSPPGHNDLLFDQVISQPNSYPLPIPHLTQSLVYHKHSCLLNCWPVILNQGVILFSRAHLAVPENIFDCHNMGKRVATDI